jgi:hypothetical protein
VLFGFDRKTLFLRLEPADGRAAELAGARLEVDIAIPGQGDRHVAVGSRSDGVVTVDGARAGTSVHGRTLELALPLSSIGVVANERLLLTLRLFAAEGDAPLARYPADGGLAVTVPGDGFEAENWSA